MSANTLFLRLEGPLQSWGSNESKAVIRRTREAPTKSGVLGLLFCALGLSRTDARTYLPYFGKELMMGVRIDRPGDRWWDYHTVGAKIGNLTAEGKIKITPNSGTIETLVSKREYLCDASFLVVLQGRPDWIADLASALSKPKWTPYLGRKSCPPSRPILEPQPTGEYQDLFTALKSVPWQPRLKGDPIPKTLECLMDWKPSELEPQIPDDAEIWYDLPISFSPPAHQARVVIRKVIPVGSDGEISVADKHLIDKTPPPPRPRANYANTQYRIARLNRLNRDYHLCVFCKSYGTAVQHITYRRAGGNETGEDLRTLCRLCHDAVTMIEYGLGMGLDRINPEDPKYRDLIINKRDQIVLFRSQETRRRKLEREDVD